MMCSYTVLQCLLQCVLQCVLQCEFMLQHVLQCVLQCVQRSCLPHKEELHSHEKNAFRVSFCVSIILMDIYIYMYIQ